MILVYHLEMEDWKTFDFGKQFGDGRHWILVDHLGMEYWKTLNQQLNIKFVSMHVNNYSSDSLMIGFIVIN